MLAPIRLVSMLLVTTCLEPRLFAQTAALPSATEILAKADARMGDASKRAKLRMLVMRGTVELPDCSKPDLPIVKGSFEKTWLGPDRARMHMEWAKHWLDQGTTGAFVWSSDDFLGVTIREGDEQGPVRRIFDLERRGGWKEMYASAQTLGVEERAELGGRRHYKIQMNPATGIPEIWFVDAETYDVGELDTTVPESTGGWVAARFLYSDFREVEGIRFPYLHTLMLGEVPARFHVESLELNGSMQPDKVAPSADVLAALKDPSKRARSVPKDAESCALEEVAAQPALTIRLTVASSEVSKTLAVILPEVIGVMAQAGGEMSGPPFSRYHSDDGKTIDLEAGIPLKKRVEGKGRVQASELPGGKAAMTWHVGSYDNLAKAHARLAAWIKTQSLQSRGGPWETYWTDPGIEPDTAKWRTQLYWPVQ